MVRRYPRRRIKPGRYILLLLLVWATYALTSTQSPQEPAAAKLPEPVIHDQAAPQPAVAETPPAIQNTSEVEPPKTTFTFLDELAALEAIDITAITKLDLLEQNQAYYFDTTLVFTNSNAFPVVIKDSSLDAALVLQDGLQLQLGTLRIADVRLETADDLPQGTRVNVIIEHPGLLHDLQETLRHNFAADGQETVRLPLQVTGRLAVKIPLAGTLSVDRTIDLAFEYQPGMDSTVLQTFRQSVEAASTRKTKG